MFRRLGTAIAPRALLFITPSLPTTTITTIKMAPTMLLTARRAQGSLQSLMSDPDDAYLQAIQQLDLADIASIMAAGPPLAPPRTPASDRLHREQRRIQQQREAAQPAAAATVQKDSGAGAVLASLRAEGLRKVAATQAAEAAAEEAAARGRTAAEEEARAAARRVTHLYEGLCAVNAVLRVQVEDGSITPEELDVALAVFKMVVAARETVPAEQWEADFVPELKSFKFIFNAKDTRELEF